MGCWGQPSTGLQVLLSINSLGAMNRRRTGFAMESGGSPVKPLFQAGKVLRPGTQAASPSDLSGNLVLFPSLPIATHGPIRTHFLLFSLLLLTFNVASKGHISAPSVLSLF